MRIKTFLFRDSFTTDDANTNYIDGTVNEFITQVESNGGKIIDVKMNSASMDRESFYMYIVSYEEPKK